MAERERETEREGEREVSTIKKSIKLTVPRIETQSQRLACKSKISSAKDSASGIFTASKKFVCIQWPLLYYNPALCLYYTHLIRKINIFMVDACECYCTPFLDLNRKTISFDKLNNIGLYNLSSSSVILST